MRVKVIANPGAGQPEPVLSVLNQTLGEAGIDWDVAVTHAAGDAFNSAREAAEQGYDLVGVYGGGGPETPLRRDSAYRAHCRMQPRVASGEYDLRPVDMSRWGDDWFIVRLTIRLEVSIVEGAKRERKERLGWLAYAMAGLRTLADPPIANYAIEVDGEVIEAEGIAGVRGGDSGRDHAHSWRDQGRRSKNGRIRNAGVVAAR